jgi:hypothetical protein
MSIDAIKWNRDGLCGAACAQMVLYERGVVGATPNDQEALWTLIKDLTNGPSSAPQGAACSGLVPEIFNGMIRDACGGYVVKCWCTHPNALKATLKAKLAAGAPITLSKIADEDRANTAIRRCLQRGGLPIVLVNSANHWVVVDGWNENDPYPVSMLDPAVGEPAPVALDDWNNDYMSAVDCTGSKLDRKYVIVQVG